MEVRSLNSVPAGGTQSGGLVNSAVRVCSHVASKSMFASTFATVPIVTQAQKMGPTYSLCLHSCHHEHNVELDVDVDANVTCDQGFAESSGCYANTESVPHWYKIQNNFVKTYVLRIFFFVLYFVNNLFYSYF